jgi:apolipoprotein N-acyltransferase
MSAGGKKLWRRFILEAFLLVAGFSYIHRKDGFGWGYTLFISGLMGLLLATCNFVIDNLDWKRHKRALNTGFALGTVSGFIWSFVTGLDHSGNSAPTPLYVDLFISALIGAFCGCMVMVVMGLYFLRIDGHFRGKEADLFNR